MPTIMETCNATYDPDPLSFDSEPFFCTKPADHAETVHGDDEGRRWIGRGQAVRTATSNAALVKDGMDAVNELEPNTTDTPGYTIEQARRAGALSDAREILRARRTGGFGSVAEPYAVGELIELAEYILNGTVR